MGLPTLMRVDRFCALYGGSEAVVRRWCREGKLVARKVGHVWYIDMDRSFDAKGQETPQARRRPRGTC